MAQRLLIVRYRRIEMVAFLSMAVALASTSVTAGSLVAPGDAVLRHDLQLLNSAGLIHIPLSSWPISQDDIRDAIGAIDEINLSGPELAALSRIRHHVAISSAIRTRYTASAAANPREIRTFDYTPRDEGELGVELNWSNETLSANVRAGYTANPGDSDHVRFDRSWVGYKLGNWILSAGWQDRWWGPGYNGSLIMSTNARPVPALAVQRNRSRAFDSRWLRWIGPWTMNVFMGRLDDDRWIDDALFFGMRIAFTPTDRIEVGLSRTAQWCGAGRPCGGSEFVDLLLGRDNSGVNVGSKEEPGNQLAGVDVRWRPLSGSPMAFYLQWIGEDTRQGGPELGSWLRLAGFEFRGESDGGSYSTYAEVADTSCREGGLGFSDIKADCGYEHSIFRTGYRYKGRSLGHGIDGDGLSYSVGATLVQSAGHRWSALLRFSDINRVGTGSSTHSLAALPMEQVDMMLGHGRQLSFGTLELGLGWRRRTMAPADSGKDEALAYVEWRSR